MINTIVHMRLAQKADLPAILAIYNEAVLNTTATWDYEPSTLSQRILWFEQHQQAGLPIIVAERTPGTIVGWGSLNKFRDKIAYQFTVEHSVYVAAGYRGQGIGRTLLTTLIDSARDLGKQVMLGSVASDNEVSLRLHQALGFQQVAHFKRVGYKAGRWLDLIFFEHILSK